MAVITRYFCDICTKEDPGVYAWFLGPWTRRRGGSDVMEFAVCSDCIPKVQAAVKSLVKEIKEV